MSDPSKNIRYEGWADDVASILLILPLFANPYLLHLDKAGARLQAPSM